MSANGHDHQWEFAIMDIDNKRAYWVCLCGAYWSQRLRPVYPPEVAPAHQDHDESEFDKPKDTPTHEQH